MCRRPKAPAPPPPPPAPPKAASPAPEDLQTFEFDTNLQSTQKKRKGKKRFKKDREKDFSIGGDANFGGEATNISSGGLTIPKSVY